MIPRQSKAIQTSGSPGCEMGYSDTSMIFLLRPSSCSLSPRRDVDVFFFGGGPLFTSPRVPFIHPFGTRNHIDTTAPLLHYTPMRFTDLKKAKRAKPFVPRVSSHEARGMMVHRNRPNHGLCYSTVEFPSGVSRTINVSCRDSR